MLAKIIWIATPRPTTLPARLFRRAKGRINRTDALTAPPLAAGVKQFSFGLNRPDRFGFGVAQIAGGTLVFEFKALMPVAEVRLLAVTILRMPCQQWRWGMHLVCLWMLPESLRI